MENKTITFEANQQCLRKTGGPNIFATKTVSYVEAHFDLGENWSGFDSVSAVWWNDFVKPIPAVLDTEGICEVPHEVLTMKGEIYVNLVGSIAEGDVLTARLTTAPITAFCNKFNAKLGAGTSQPITPSEYEQFVASVKADADRAEDAKDSARVYAGNALSSAQNALVSETNASTSETNAHTSEVNAKASELNAETYKDQAQTYAQNADISATNAENAKDEAIDARDEILGMSATATTLPAGSNATASYSDGVLSLGIPKGDKGDKGNTGDTGAPAGFGSVTATVDDTIGTPSVEVTASGADTAKNFAFAFHNLKGQKGDKGDTGDVSQAQLDVAVSDLKSAITNETNARILLAGRVTTAEGDIDTLETHKVAQPLDGNNQPTNGTSGQSLRTKGDGTTEWADIGLPTDEQTAQAVSDWLDDHPEATTTVQDGAITRPKLNSALDEKLIFYVSNLSELSSALAAGRRIIAFKEGVSLSVSSTIKINNGTTLIGNGATFTRESGFEGKMFNVGTDCYISNLRIDGNRTAMVNPSWDTTIEMSLFGFCTLEDCVFEHGNECVIAYNDCNRITHCKFVDCGGNAIHFSGGKYTVVDGCYVNGSNKRSGMGHENGCIIWSSECAYATCVNNYCEDGLSGFGRIGSIHAGYVKIIGNTVVNCGHACEVGNTASNTAPARDILIANNLFVNSVNIKLYKTTTNTCDIGRVSIIGNDFIETEIHGDRFTNLVISNNNLRGKAAFIHLERCVSTVVSNNVINNTANATRTLFFYACINLVISNNYIRGGSEAVFGNGSINVSVEGNHVSAYCPSASDLAISVVTESIFKNNVVASYGKGMDAGTGCQVIGNQFWLVNAANAIRTWGGTGKCIVALNMTNQTFSLANSSDAQYVSNVAGATTNIFTTATLNLTNITSDGLATAVLGDDYICKLTADEGYLLPDTITVSVNGQTLYASEFRYDKTTGEVEIYGIIGAVVITASAVS